MLPDTELGILQTLHAEKRQMVATEIAGDLDCSGQLVGRRAKNLSDRALVSRERAGAVLRYGLTEKATEAYFTNPKADDLGLSK